MHPSRWKVFSNYFLKLRRKSECQASLKRLRGDLEDARGALSNHLLDQKARQNARARRSKVYTRKEAQAEHARRLRSAHQQL